VKLRLIGHSLFVISKALFAALLVLALITLFINLSWFDEPLHPELVALTEFEPVSMDDNAYAWALGFLATQDKSPLRAGQQIVEALRERYEEGQRIALEPQQMERILGGSNLDQAWRADFQSLSCSSRVYLNCAELLIAEVAQAESRHSRLDVLLSRYSTILSQRRFQEHLERDVFSPLPPYRQLMDVARLRLAISYESDSTADFLSKSAEDFAFWLRILRESDTLPSKMVSLAGLQNNLDFLSTLMRNRGLEESEYLQIQMFLSPFTREESDIGEAFISEARVALLSERPPMVMGSSWLMRLLVQKSATLNEEYLTTFIPMRLRASFSAREYYRHEAFKTLPYAFRVFPPPLYNLGGKIARNQAWRDAEAYTSRVHDQNGRILLLLLQAEIERSPTSAAVRDVVVRSIYRNPYTEQPMDYDTERQTVGFECLHTVFHPPNPPDVCAVAIGR
jgi:hypothetical protein